MRRDYNRQFDKNEMVFYPEIFRYEWDHETEFEINRSSAVYAKWVQSSLNRIMKLRLSVDGIIGPKTRSAIRSFQAKARLLVDGIVGPNTEAALLRAGAGSPPGSGASPPITAPPAVYVPQPGLSSLRSNIVSIALQEWNKWGKGNTKETDASIRETLKDYWLTGTGSIYGFTNSLAWSAAFISWVVKNAGGGNNFRYSAAHSTYTYYAKLNREQNNTNPFKAYRISEKKPEAGDIVVQNRGSSSFTYENIAPDKPGTHGDFVVRVTGSSAEVIGGNLSDSVSYGRIPLRPDGLINSTSHFAIIKSSA